MEETSIFQKTLEGIHADNAHERLHALDSDNAVQRQLLFNPVTDVVYFSGNEILLVLCDFLPGSEQKRWLADEEIPEDTPPLYFSESSHRQSPVFKLRRARAFFARFFPESAYRIRLLLLCNYEIINYEDILPEWTRLDVQVVEQTTDDPPFFPRHGKESKTSEDKGTDLFTGSDLEGEFDRMLDEFLEKELQQPSSEYGTDSDETEKATDAPDTPEERQEDEEPFILPIPASECFDVSQMKLFHLSADPDDDDCRESAMRTFNVRRLVRIAVKMTANYIFSRIPAGNFYFTLYNETGQQLEHGRMEARFSPQEYKEVSLWAAIGQAETPAWKKGKYLLEIRFGKEILVMKSFMVGSKDVEGKIIGENEDGLPVPSLRRLDRMVGLRRVKEQMARYSRILRLAGNRKARGLQGTMPSLHAVFMGNPGTGKTTVARLYGGILKELGLLKNGHVVRVERSTLTGTTYGSEEEKTRAAIEQARGGVLFIDEAYTLYTPHDPKDPGKNILQTLLTAMEDDPEHDYAILLAGYSNEMTGMLDSNPGLQSRIPVQNRYIFEDYTVDNCCRLPTPTVKTTTMCLRQKPGKPCGARWRMTTADATTPSETDAM